MRLPFSDFITLNTERMNFQEDAANIFRVAPRPSNNLTILESTSLFPSWCPLLPSSVGLEGGPLHITRVG